MIPRSLSLFPVAAWLLALAGTAAASEYDCVIEPRRVLELRSPLDGLIERVNVDRGDPVTMGQELIVLDTSVDRAQAEIARHRSTMEGAILSGRARLAFAERKFARMENLRAQSYVSEQARDEAATERRLAETELREAEDNRRLAELEYRRQLEVIRLKTIRSPISGVVVERVLNPGELAEAGVGRKPILKLAEIHVLHVEALLPVGAWGKLRRGTKAAVTPETGADGPLTATVKVIDKVLDAASGTFGVRLELPNPGHRIPAGIRCRVNFPGLDAGPARGSRSDALGHRRPAERHGASGRSRESEF